MSIAHTLAVVGQDIGIHLPIRKALILLERSYLNDTFITIPNFKQEILDIENNQFSIQLLKNTYGSFYRVVLLGDMDVELLNCFFIMPDEDSNLQDLSLLTAYPEIEISITSTSFLQLSDAPKSYIGQAGKVIAVKQDESGLEFIECKCNDDGGVTPPVISCVGATNRMSFSHISGDFDIFVDDMETPIISDSIGPALSELNNIYQGKIESDYDGFLYMANLEGIPHRLKFVPKPNSNASFTANIEENPTFIVHEDQSFTFCLATAPKCIFEGVRIDLNGLDVHFTVSGLDIGSILVTDPNGQQNTYNPESGEVIHLGYIEGFYTINSANGFDNLRGDVYFKSSLNESIVPKPTINSVIRDANNIVTILGTATPYSIVALIPNDNDDEPIAYSKVLEGESNFSFVLELPIGFAGYIRCREGNIGSEGEIFSI